MDNRKRELGAIWDLDGVIIDSFQFHFAAWRQLAWQRGWALTEDDFLSAFGLAKSEHDTWFFGPSAAADEVEAVWQQKEAIFRDRIKGNIKALPGALQLLRSLKVTGFRTSLVSFSPPETIALVLSSLGIEQLFEFVVSVSGLCQEIKSPELFVSVANQLGVEPDHCVVIEDEIAGVEAAKAAGMKCIAVTNTYPRESFTAADLLIDSLEKLDSRDIELLFK